MKREEAQKRCIIWLLALAMFITSFSIIPARVQAASRAVINDETLNIGINGSIPLNNYLIKRSRATYTFTSSRPSVAKVNARGKITGLKAGSTKIKITEKYKGKKKTIGSVKVVVRKARMWEDSTYVIDVDEYEDTYDFKGDIMYVNPKATYKIYSDDTSLVKITTRGKITYADAEDGDTTTFTVKETYKGKTHSIGKVEVEFQSQDDEDYDDEDYDDEDYEDYDDEDDYEDYDDEDDEDDDDEDDDDEDDEDDDYYDYGDEDY